jgi:alpha-mannosidase
MKTYRDTFGLLVFVISTLLTTTTQIRAQGTSSIQPLPPKSFADEPFMFKGDDASTSAPQIEGPTLYLVSNSHIDTQWNWTVQDTISKWVPRTFFDNFKLFEQYPNYKFNFEGVIHYMFFKEHHPEAWPRLKAYVAQGRWKLAGSWIDAVDPNVPSAESLMRQALYGKRFFRHEFGMVSDDVYLPDCFGFGYSLPSIAAHCGMKAFSTQKLASWGGAIYPPFVVGRWVGVDGSSVIAALRGGSYSAKIRSDISVDKKWTTDLTDLGGGKKVGFRYFGVGDQGGAPDAETVGWVEKALANQSGEVRVVHAAADQLSKDLTEEEKAALPVYNGELLMKTHGVGCYTSQAAMKKWNRKNEQLADAAERASVTADWLGGPHYPGEKLRTAWTRFLWHQFHDDLTGTSIPQAYVYSWNDELISLNEFASTITDAVGSIASGMDTRGQGVPLVVYNPLAMDRPDVVEATVHFDGPAPAAVRVFDPQTGHEVPSQVLSSSDGDVRILLLAQVPSVGYKVFDVRPSTAPTKTNSTLSVVSVGRYGLENARYRVHLDENGDIGGVFDKAAGVELLKEPARLDLFDDRSIEPAWEIAWEDLAKGPRKHVSGPAQIKVIENGPVRVALEVTRTTDGSTFVQQIRLVAGGEQVEVDTRVDWKTPGTLLKASFPLTASNQKATFDLGLGTIERGNGSEKLYEVPGHEWADIGNNAYGVAILNDSKYGWDKPADNVLRLTLIHTPDPGKKYMYQGTNDIGHHHFTYAIAGHRGDWRAGSVPSRAARLNQPLEAFQTVSHRGPLGKSFSMLSISSDQVAVRAFKKAEDSDEIVVRLQELYGRPASGVEIQLAGSIVSAREINAAEEPVADRANVRNERLVVDLKSYQPRSFALKLNRAGKKITAPQSLAVVLPFNLDGVSLDSDRRDGDFDGKGRTIPGELLPAALTLDGIDFRLGPSSNGAKNVVASSGQEIRLPAGSYDRIYLLATSVDGDASDNFTIKSTGGKGIASELKIQEWDGVTGQWDSRLQNDRISREVFTPPEGWTKGVALSQMVMKLVDGKIEGLENLRPGFIKRDEVAWIGTHRHSPEGNEPYVYCKLFKYAINLPKGATSITLPQNARIRVMAISVAKNSNDRTTPAGYLYE